MMFFPLRLKSMFLSKKSLGVAGVFGMVCGLGVALFFLGYFSGSSKKVPVVVVAGDKLSFEESQSKYERRLSVVRLPPSVKIAMKSSEGLEQLTRYRNEKKTLYAVDTGGSGAIWSEDMVIGFADGTDKDTVIYRCFGRTKGGQEYTFYSRFQNCWSGKNTGRSAGFRLPTSNPSPLHIPVFSCLTGESNRYISLNSACESEQDTAQELLGYVRAATILVSEDQAPAPEGPKP